MHPVVFVGQFTVVHGSPHVPPLPVETVVVDASLVVAFEEELDVDVVDAFEVLLDVDFSPPPLVVDDWYVTSGKHAATSPTATAAPNQASVVVRI